LTPKAAATVIDTARTPRQKIVVNLLLWTGLRAGEAVSLSDEDVDLERREIRVRTSKTPRGRRTIPLLPQLEELSANGAPIAPTTLWTSRAVRFSSRWLERRCRRDMSGASCATSPPVQA
jgi:integrase